MRILLFILFSTFLSGTFAQTDSVLFIADSAAVAKRKWWQSRDTAYYRKYNDRFVAALYTSYRAFNIQIEQTTANDSLGMSSLDYRADANEVTGVEFNYDKFSVSFGIKSKPPDRSKKGITYYNDFGFSFGASRWLIETSYRSYRGFYDLRTARYDASYTDTSSYYLNPSMRNRSMRAKFFYFDNHERFSYRAAYSCTYRQLRSSVTRVYVMNIYQNKLTADTSLIPYFVRGLYGSNAYLNRLGVTGVSAGGGFAMNIVIMRSLFVNVTFALGVESQWRNYGYFEGRSRTVNYLSLSGDGRFSFGFNTRNFFMTLSSLNDFSSANGSGLKLKTKFLSGAFTIGYRFKVKDPPVMEKVRETKWYKMI